MSVCLSVSAWQLSVSLCVCICVSVYEYVSVCLNVSVHVPDCRVCVSVGWEWAGGRLDPLHSDES